MSTFILRVYSYGDRDSGVEPKAAILNLTRDYAEILLRRMDAAKALHQQDDQLYSAEYWDNTVDWIDADDAMPDDETMKQLETRGRVEIDSVADDRIEFERMECCLLVAQPDEVRWTGIVRHTDVKVETEPIPLEVIAHELHRSEASARS